MSNIAALNPENDEKLHNLQSEVSIARETLVEAEKNLSDYLKQREKDVQRQMLQAAKAYGFSIHFGEPSASEAKPAREGRGAGEGRRTRAVSSSNSDVQVRLQNPKTGETWKGRGQKPLWLRRYLESGEPIKHLAAPGVRWDGKVLKGADGEHKPQWVEILLEGGFTEEELKAGVPA